jgi:aldose 1-epimerase
MKSSITRKIVSRLNGKDIVLFRLTGEAGAYVEAINYGATLVSVFVPDRKGQLENVILRYPKVEDYFADTFCLGSSIGRFANRIAGARFTLNEKEYLLEKNEEESCLHSGLSGFHKKIFDAEIDGNEVVFSAQSGDGESGFPGNMDITIRLSFSNNMLTIRYVASCDRDTLFNPTCHAYFNLTGQKNDIFSHELQIHASEYLEMNPSFLPTGKILPVADTAYDFRQYNSVGNRSALKQDYIKGYNTCFVVSDTQSLKHQASLRETSSGRMVDVFSTMPGVLLYTGDYLSGEFQPFSGICLEAQFYPDAPNQAHFPACVITPSKMHEQQITYQFNMNVN